MRQKRAVFIFQRKERNYIFCNDFIINTIFYFGISDCVVTHQMSDYEMSFMHEALTCVSFKRPRHFMLFVKVCGIGHVKVF